MVGSAVESDHGVQERTVLGAGSHLAHQSGIAQRVGDLSLGDVFGQVRRAQHWHGVHDYSTGLGGS